MKQKILKNALKERAVVVLESYEFEKPEIKTCILCQIVDKSVFLRSTTYDHSTYVILDEKDYKENLISGLGPPLDTLTVYYLPWRREGIEYMQLGQEADIFITPTLSGCTFTAITNQAGESIVFHANYSNSSGKIDQGQIDEKLTEIIEEKCQDIKSRFSIKKSDYFEEKNMPAGLIAGKNERCTVIGFKENEEWQYYSSIYTHLWTDSLEQKRLRSGKSSLSAEPFFEPKLLSVSEIKLPCKKSIVLKKSVQPSTFSLWGLFGCCKSNRRQKKQESFHDDLLISLPKSNQRIYFE